MFRLVVSFGALLAFVCAQTTDVSQCTANPGELPLNAYIAGCSSPPCQLPQLQNAVINIIFRAPRTMRTMTTVATAYLSFIGLPVPIPYDLEENALTCNFLDNSYCPVLEGEILEYTLLMYIQTSFPVGISPTIEFRIQDEYGAAIICIRVPITITAPIPQAAHNATASAVDASH